MPKINPGIFCYCNNDPIIPPAPNPNPNPNNGGGNGNNSNLPTLTNNIPPADSIIDPIFATNSSNYSPTADTDGILNEPNKIHFDNQTYFLALEFCSYANRYLLNNQAIAGMEMIDSFFDWPQKGSISIKNNFEVFERYNDPAHCHYVRSDGRDSLNINFFPIPDPGANLDENIWTIKTKNVIYDVEDLNSSHIKNKIKKFYFWDEDFEFFQERKIQWSTATEQKYKTNKVLPISQCSDSDRAMYTGDAIKALLIASGLNPEYIDETKWDRGFSKIFYTCKANLTVWENIQYILSKHAGKDKKEKCFLTRDAYTRKFSLLPLSWYFEKAGKSLNEPGEFQREHLFFESMGSETNTDPYKSPFLNAVDTSKDYKAPRTSKIIRHRFSQMSGFDNAKALVSKPIYSHNTNQKQFNVDVYENEIKRNREDYFKKWYVDKLYGADPYPLFLLNKTKEEQVSIEPKYSLYSSIVNEENDRAIRSLDGRGEILYASTFLNNCLVVEVLGSTNRKSGTFIAVDRVGQSTENTYDYLICGQYLVVEVKHLIKDNKYINELTMIKIHAYKDHGQDVKLV